MKLTKKSWLSTLFLFSAIYLFICPILAIQTCTLNIYVRDQSGNPLVASVYIDNGYLGQYSQVSRTVTAWDQHLVEATRTGYTSDSEYASCACGGYKNVYLTLTQQCIPNWQCNPWSVCINGIQTRTCSDGCGNTKTETQACYIPPVPEEGEGSLKVHVSDCSDRRPIVGARVNVLNGLDLEDRTNDYGYAYFNDLPENRYEASALAEGYIGDYRLVNVYDGQMTVVDICLREDDDYEEDVSLEIDDLDLSPSVVCIGEDEEVEISIPVELEKGDDVDVKVSFYIRNDNWNYIGRDTKELDNGDEEDFTVFYEFDAYSLEEGTYKIKAEIEAGDEEETEYAYLKVEDCFSTSGDYNIEDITLNPRNPKLGDMVVGETRIEFNRYVSGYRNVKVEARVDGNLEKSGYLSFSYEGQSKNFDFAFDTEDYGIGYHTVRIIVNVDGKRIVKEKSFYISKDGYAYEEPYDSESEHCLRINKIEVLNDPVRAGEKARISVEVENCGDYTERSINAKLENSDVIFANLFNLNPGGETELIFEPEVISDETLVFSVWNGYNSIKEEYELKVSSGKLSIYLDSEYNLISEEQNKINFEVKNIGNVRDNFELRFSENVAGWSLDLPMEIELSSGEMRTIEVSIEPQINSGEIDFEIFSETEGGKTNANSKFRVHEKFKWPEFTFFTGGFWVLGGIVPWFLALLLLLILVLLVLLLLRELYRLYKKRYSTSRVYGSEEGTSRKYFAVSKQEKKSTGATEDDCRMLPSQEGEEKPSKKL